MGLADGYKTSLYEDRPLEMVISPSLNPIKALAVANHGRPKIIGFPQEGSFAWITMNSVGYFNEATITMTSSNNPAGFAIV